MKLPLEDRIRSQRVDIIKTRIARLVTEDRAAKASLDTRLIQLGVNLDADERFQAIAVGSRPPREVQKSMKTSPRANYLDGWGREVNGPLAFTRQTSSRAATYRQTQAGETGFRPGRLEG